MLFEAKKLGCRIGDRVLFDSVSFALEPGESLAVCGRSGVGKTLLLRALAWLDPICCGRVTLGGRRPEAWGAPGWRVRVTYVAQRPAVMPGTPAEHAAEITRLAAQRGREVANPVAIAERWGLPADAWKRAWSRLSGGEQSRAALAIAVAHNPDVLLLDEPTAAVDDASSACIERDLRGRTVVWVTHDSRQASRVASQVLELEA